MSRSRFRGHILGIGTTSGVRCVVGWWIQTPLGEFVDVMVEDSDGHRVLLAPNLQVANLLEGTYRFDEVALTRFVTTRPDDGLAGRWSLRSSELDLSLTVGARHPLGHLLRCVPTGVATAPAFCRVIDPVARLARGVRTHGVARAGRRESYGATDVHRIIAADGTWRGQPLGALAPVRPPVRFGFSSTLVAPTCTSLVTTIDGWP